MLIRRLNVNGRCPVCQCSLRLCQVTRLGVRPGPGQDIVPAGGITTQTANNGSDPDQILQLPRLGFNTGILLLLRFGFGLRVWVRYSVRSMHRTYDRFNSGKFYVRYYA